MRQFSIFLWVLFGSVVGYQLRESMTTFTEKENPPPQIQTVVKEVVKQVIKKVPVEVPGKCDYRAYEETIADLQEQLNINSTPVFRDVVIPVYVPSKVIVSKPKRSSITILGSLGEGVRSVDIKTSPDGNSVYGEPKMGMIGGISGYYKHSSGFTIGGGVIGAQSKFGSVGWTWDFP